MKKQPPPNILLINCDDLGYGDPGCYGSTVNSTPAIDRLAREGTRFTDFYMASAVCSPSRCAMLTGCYPTRIGCGEFEGKPVLFPGQGVGLNPAETTIARMLKTAGYATALVGKWHCGDQPDFLPTRHGFDQYYGLPYSNDMSRMQGRPNSVPLPLMRDEEVIQEQPDQTCLTERYVEESVRFMRENAERPFLLYFAHMHVHLPLLVSERFLKTAKNGSYGAAVECIDWATAALLAEIERLGLNDNTIIIFTSDNGSRGAESGEGGSNSPLRGSKTQSWEGGFRVPCIVRWPGKVPAGRVEHSIFTSMDFLPTIARLAGSELPAVPIDGVDFSRFLTGENTNHPRDTFAYYRKNDLCAVREGKWKLHMRAARGNGGETMQELYDLDADISESKNLYATEPEVVARLGALADNFRKELGDEASGISGNAIRPAGRVDNPGTLTQYNPQHPYMIAMYDGEAG